MRRIRAVILLSCALLSFVSCKPNAATHDDAQPEAVAKPESLKASEKLATEFPLLPIIEGPQWQKLQRAEAVASDLEATDEQRSDAAAETTRIMELLQKRHPFQQDGNRITLGGIVYDKQSGKIEIPVTVCYPRVGDNRHPGELEVILCAVTGRSHETLFTTATRPLHLELLMHLAGYHKSPPASTFKVEVIIPDHDAIPIEALIASADGDPLPERLLWEFSGGEFKDPYLPDMTGDFLICWHAHESVLRIRHEGIASGELKLKPVPHPALKQHQSAILVLSPSS